MPASTSSKGNGSDARRDAATADPAKVAAICREALYSPNEAAALAQLQPHARWIVAHLGDETICEALTVDPPGSVSHERIAAVYDILAQAEPGAILPVDTGRELIEDNLEEEREIGRAFKNDLLHKLAPALKNLVVYFAAVPRVSRKEERQLLRTASVNTAWPQAGGLVACGLTPLSVFYASRNVASLARRLREAGALGGDSLALEPLRGAAPSAGPHASLSQRVAQEIVQVDRCSEPAASALVDWLIEVSKVKHLVFASYRAEPEGAGVRLVTDEDYSHKPLDERWREMSPARQEAPVGPPGANPLLAWAEQR